MSFLSDNEKIVVDEGSCVLCGACVAVCEYGAIRIFLDSLSIDHDKCEMCQKCVEVCPRDALVKEGIS